MNNKKPRGLNETLSVPQQHRDSNPIAVRAFDHNFRIINGGLVSMARSLNALQKRMDKPRTSTSGDMSLVVEKVIILEKKQNAHNNALKEKIETLKKSHDVQANTVSKKLNSIEKTRDAQLGKMKKDIDKKIATLEKNQKNQIKLLNDIFTMLQQATAPDEIEE